MSELPLARSDSTLANRSRLASLPGYVTFKRFRGHRAGMLGAVVLVFLIGVAALAPMIAPYDPIAPDPVSSLQDPGRHHLLGTDLLGRDTLSRLMHGARVSLQVGLITMGIATLVGVPIGLVSGYFGGWVDHVLMRLVDTILAFPGLVLALALIAALGSGTRNVMIAVGVVAIPSFARLVRGQALAVREHDYVAAARCLGGSHLRILFRHIAPNVMAPVIVQVSLGAAGAILAEAGLSFLGLGVQPPAPTWGGMLSIGFQYINLSKPLVIFPGMAIFVTVLALNFFGDGLRDALDPRLKGT
jgi:ABC-type dipeptide/oligopeptide/nickel transport system permease subunit